MACPETSQTFNVADRLATQSINPQLDSPLFNVFPPEIRNRIFDFAFTEYRSPQFPAPDFALRYDHEAAPVPNVPADMPPRPTQRSPRRPMIGHRGRLPASVVRPQRYTTGCDWERPEGSGHMITDTALLRTCRKIYLETYALPLMLKEHKFFCFRGPSHRRGDLTFGEVLNDPSRFLA